MPRRTTKSKTHMKLIVDLFKMNNFKYVDYLIPIISIAFLIYFMLATSIIYQASAFYLPLYLLYHAMNNNLISEVQILVKYLIIYGHIEFTFSIITIIGPQMYPLRIIAGILLLYLTMNEPNTFSDIYVRIIEYDHHIIRDIHLKFKNLIASIRNKKLKKKRNS